MPTPSQTAKLNFLAALQPLAAATAAKKTATAAPYPAMTVAITTGPLAGQWEAAKANWKKEGARTVTDRVATLLTEQGWTNETRSTALLKNLKDFDKANKSTKPEVFQNRRVGWAKSKEVIDAFVAVGKTAQKVNDANILKDLPHGAQSLSAMLELLKHIRATGEAACQDPKPSGKDIHVKILYSRSASGGVRPAWLKGGTLSMNVHLVMDEKLSELEKAGTLGFHWIEMQRACNAVADKHIADFQHVIGKLDERFALIDAELTIIAKDRKIMNIRRNEERRKKLEAKRDKLANASNETLRHYATIVQNKLQAAVDQYWNAAKQRLTYLRSFKLECVKDVAVASLAITVSAVTIGLSLGGSTALSAVVIAKSIAEIGLTLQTGMRDAGDLQPILAKSMKSVEEVWAERQRALAAGEGQKANKALQVAKEAFATGVGPFSAKFMTTTSRSLKQATEYSGKLTVLEHKLGKLYKRITLLAETLPNGEGSDAQMSQQYTDFLKAKTEFERAQPLLRGEIEWATWSVETCTQLTKEDYVPKWMNNAGIATKSLIGIGSAIKLIVEVCLKFK